MRTTIVFGYHHRRRRRRSRLVKRLKDLYNRALDVSGIVLRKTSIFEDQGHFIIHFRMYISYVMK